MNLSDAALAPSATTPTSALGSTPDPADLDPQALLTQLGAEVARKLSSALERVTTLVTTGQIDRASLRALRDEIDGARRAGIMGQQLVRLADNDLHMAHETVDLAGLLREALTLRQREAQARQLAVKQTLAEVPLVSDATLVFALIETVLDWSFEHARSRIVFRLDTKPTATDNASPARLTCAFLRHHPDAARRRAPDPSRSAAGSPQHPEDPALNTLAWRLLQQTAAVLGLKLKRRDTSDRCELRVTFPTSEAPVATTTAAAAAAAAPSLSGLDADHTGLQAPFTHTLLGRHIVVLSAQRDLRNIVRDALRPTGSMVDFVTTLDEAKRLFEDALPHAVVYEASQGGARFDRMRNTLLLEVPTLAFIQITPDGRAFEVLEADGHPYASVGLDGLVESLPAALLFELSRHG
jgi:hypothetical protein